MGNSVFLLTLSKVLKRFMVGNNIYCRQFCSFLSFNNSVSVKPVLHCDMFRKQFWAGENIVWHLPYVCIVHQEQMKFSPSWYETDSSELLLTCLHRNPSRKTGTLLMASFWGSGLWSCWCSSRPMASNISNTSSDSSLPAPQRSKNPPLS